MVATHFFCLFSPLFFGEDFQFDKYFSDGLVQPPTRFIEKAFLSQRELVHQQWSLAAINWRFMLKTEVSGWGAIDDIGYTFQCKAPAPRKPSSNLERKGHNNCPSTSSNRLAERWKAVQLNWWIARDFGGQGASSPVEGWDFLQENSAKKSAIQSNCWGFSEWNWRLRFVAPTLFETKIEAKILLEDLSSFLIDAKSSRNFDSFGSFIDTFLLLVYRVLLGDRLSFGFLKPNHFPVLTWCCTDYDIYIYIWYTYIYMIYIYMDIYIYTYYIRRYNWAMNKILGCLNYIGD